MNVGLLHLYLCENLPELKLYLGYLGDLSVVRVLRVVLDSLRVDILKLLGLFYVPGLYLLIIRVEPQILFCPFPDLYESILDRLEDCLVLLGCRDCL